MDGNERISTEMCFMRTTAQYTLLGYQKGGAEALQKF
jgi:hypothetical protein